MRPMLAALSTDKILEKHLKSVPLLISNKLDGIRAITTEDGLKSRSLKPIRNKHTQEIFKNLPAGLDGELIVGPASAPNVFNVTTSGIMSSGGTPYVRYHVFDFWNLSQDILYQERYAALKNLMATKCYPFVQLVRQTRVSNLEQLHRCEKQTLADGYEGLIARRPDAPYKFNRSTANEGYLLKIKRFCDSEAEILCVNQKLANNNEPIIDELGYTKRSSSKEHKTPVDQVGSFFVKDLKKGWKFEVHGFSHVDAAIWWENRKQLIGKIVNYKYLSVGMVNVPRHPIFKGFRDREDM